MSDAAVKESRRILRRVQEHLSQAHLNLGATAEPIGLVDVVYHPTNPHPRLNYVSPRKNTVWVPTPEIQKGVDRLRVLKRKPRVIYIEGLYPPLFAKSIRDLGLVVEHEVALLTRKIEAGQFPPGEPLRLPDGLRLEEVVTPETSVLWGYVWHNAGPDTLTKSIEPLQIDAATPSPAPANQVDILLYKNNNPSGVTRLTLYENTAHIVALAALATEAQTPDLVKLLYEIALHWAAQRQCTLVFTTTERESDRQICHALGFVDSGSAVCYVEATDQPKEENVDERVAQSVFALRRSKESPVDPSKDKPDSATA